MNDIFNNQHVELINCGNRYIVCDISSSGTIKTYASMLNNVLGNIPSDPQIPSLKKIKDILF